MQTFLIYICFKFILKTLSSFLLSISWIGYERNYDYYLNLFSSRILNFYSISDKSSADDSEDSPSSFSYSFSSCFGSLLIASLILDIICFKWSSMNPIEWEEQII